MTASLPPLPTSDQAQAARFLCDRGAEPAPATARRRKPRHESKHVRLDVPPSSNPIESLSGAAAAAAELKRTPRYQYFEELEANEYALCASEGAAAAAAAGTTGAAFPISGSAPIVMNDNYFGSRAREYFFETFHEFSHMRWAHGGEVKSVAPPFADGDADGSPARLPSNGHELVTGFDAREFFSKEAFSAALDREWHRRASQKAAPPPLSPRYERRAKLPQIQTVDADAALSAVRDGACAGPRAARPLSARALFLRGCVRVRMHKRV